MRLTRSPWAAWLLALASFSAQPQAQNATLIDLYRQALTSHPAVQSQERAVDRAAARRDQASSRLRPQLSLTAGFSHNIFRGEGSPRDEYDSRRHVLQLRQALFDVASTRQVAVEESRIAQSRDELEALRMELAGEIVERYLDVLNASDELGSLGAEREAVLGQLARLRRMHERQLAKITDLLEAEAYLATLDARQIEARNARSVALERLREATGGVVVEVAGLTAASFPPLDGDIERWVQTGMSNNRHLAALQNAIAAEDRSVAATRAQHVPQVGLTASKVWSDADSDSRRNPPFNVAAIGVQITIPIYEGGRVDAAMREAVARHEVARQQHEEKRREVEREIRTAYLKTQSDRSRIEATAQTVLAHERARDAQLKGFELGAVTVVDLLDAQRRLFRSRADHAKARHDFIRSLSTLRLQAGTLAERDLEEFSGWMGGAAR